jgi:protein SCO1/2
MNKIPHITVGRCCVAAVFPSLPACGELIKVGTPRRGVRAVTYILQIFLNLLPTLLTLLPANATPTTKLTDADLAQVRFDQNLNAQISPTLNFTDETGKPIRIGDYFGTKPSVLILGYYDCPMLCTLVLNGAADCFRTMKWKAGDQFNVIFVSINPAETPALAAAKKQSYVHNYGKNLAGNWHLLTGSQNSISTLANEVGYHYTYDPTVKQFAHPSGIVILSADGKVARYFFGVDFAAKDVDQSLRDASVNKTGALESQFTLLCFHYAPIRGKYGPLIMTIVRFGGVAVLAALTWLIVAHAVGGRK